MRSPPRPLDALDPRLRGLAQAMLHDAQVPGASIAIVAADRGYHHAHGVKSVASGAPVTAATAFSVASCTKAFVSAVVASLVAEGRVAWDDPIQRYVPEFELDDPWVSAHASLRDLSANRLGLPRAGLANAGFDPAISHERVFRGLRHTAPLHPFRSRFTYVNAGHSANALAAGRITGLGFLATLRQRILDPLGMTQTSCGEAARAGLADQAGWHTFVDGQVVAIDPYVCEASVGAGGLVTSGHDTLQWLRLQLGGGTVDGHVVIPRRELLETQTPQVVARPGEDMASLFCPWAQQAAYALGWAVSDLDGHRLVCHSGSHFGVAAMTLLLPADGIGIAVHANAPRAAVPLAYALAAELLGLPSRDWNAAFEASRERPAGPRAAGAWAAAADLDDFAGSYAHPADGPLSVHRLGARLSGDRHDGYRMAFDLVPVAEADHFAVQFRAPEWHGAEGGDPPRLRFVREGGRVVRADWLHAGTVREHRRLVAQDGGH